MSRRGREEKKRSPAQRPRARQSRRGIVECLESRNLLASNTLASLAPWHNPLNKIDVNNDHKISPLDALTVINQLNVTGTRPLAGSASAPAGSGSVTSGAIVPT